MNSRTTGRFRQRLGLLPRDIRIQARAAYRRFVENSQHPGLRFKRIHAREPIFSVRISRDYRAVGLVDGDTIIWFWIGAHEEYAQLLSQLN